ncbi:MAG: Type 1 glutamine amidotransferase-like domain-containing protein [Oscillospiraceae bacterium]|nr:Type 1 glutamine amidotransferase-like domain-containing protein [Oscillospiraceae bacterium]
MSDTIRRIVAVGGGKDGGINSKGVKTAYELAEIDREIIRLSGKENPRVLFLAHAQAADAAQEKSCCETFREIYGDRFGCDVRWLKASTLTDDLEKAKADAAWADIIYECGGDTVAMIGLWRKTGFDDVLKEAWAAGKVMSGISAGAICWFALGNTSVKEYKDREVNKIPGLGFIDAYFSPHCQKAEKRESEIRSLKHIAKVGISVSNCSAIEIVGDRYRVIKSTPAKSDFLPYVLRTYWKDGRMFEEELKESDGYQSLDRLLEMQE